MDSSPADWSQQPGETPGAWFNRLRAVDAKTLPGALAAVHMRMFQEAAVAVRAEAARQRWRAVVERGSEAAAGAEAAPLPNAGEDTVIGAAAPHAAPPASPSLVAAKAAYRALEDEDRQAFILWATRGMPD